MVKTFGIFDDIGERISSLLSLLHYIQIPPLDIAPFGNDYHLTAQNIAISNSLGHDFRNQSLCFTVAIIAAGIYQIDALFQGIGQCLLMGFDTVDSPVSAESRLAD